jgi:hypothetical protein
VEELKQSNIGTSSPRLCALAKAKALQHAKAQALQHAKAQALQHAKAAELEGP